MIFNFKINYCFNQRNRKKVRNNYQRKDFKDNQKTFHQPMISIMNNFKMTGYTEMMIMSYHNLNHNKIWIKMNASNHWEEAADKEQVQRQARMINLILTRNPSRKLQTQIILPTMKMNQWKMNKSNQLKSKNHRNWNKSSQKAWKIKESMILKIIFQIKKRIVRVEIVVMLR